METMGVCHPFGKTHATGVQLVKRCRWRVAAKVPWHSPEFGTKEQPHMPPVNAGGTEGHSHAILSEQAKDRFKIK